MTASLPVALLLYKCQPKFSAAFLELFRMKPFYCNISADVVRRAAFCVSTTEVRYYFTGVQIEPGPDGGALAVATDGSKLVVLFDPDGEVEGTAIVTWEKEQSAALRKAKDPDARFVARWKSGVMMGAALIPGAKKNQGKDATATIAALAANAFEFRLDKWRIDGSFPDWRRVIPSFPETCAAPATFDVKHLRALAEALTTSGDGKQPLTIHSGDPLDPALTLGSDRNGFGVLMPMRAGATRTGLPDWFVRPAPTKLDKQASAAA
jgi:hypothetical protein